MSASSKTPLFRGHGWDIYPAISEYLHTLPNPTLIVFAHHRACPGEGHVKAEKMNCWWLGDLKQHCVVCDAKVPDNIQALIALYTYGQETA